VAAFFTFALTGLPRAAHADQLYVSAPVSISQTGLTVTSIGGGLNQWDASINVTNTSSNPIYNVVFAQFAFEVSDDGGANFYDPVWNNSLQEWVLISPYSATVSSVNTAFYLTQSETSITFPPGEGSDSFPVIFIAGAILPLQTVSFDFVTDKTSNVNDAHITNYSVLDTPNPVPEPRTVSLTLLGCFAGGWLAYIRSHKLAKAAAPRWKIL
jgi:hypothetical protein